MKSIITIIFIFVFGYCISQPAKVIIGNSIKLEKLNKFGSNLEIAQYDFPIKMNWEDANKACKALGDRWRLPTVPELLAMGSKGYTPNTMYWSSEDFRFYINDTLHTDVNFALLKIGSSMIDIGSKTEEQSVRAIRNVDTTSLIASDKVLDKKFENSKIGNLEIALNDFPNLMTREEAIIACSNLGNGWRLPNKDELNVLYQNRYKIGGFKDFHFYWSSTADPDVRITNQYFYQSFKSGDIKKYFQDYKYLVRAVRTL
jgi:hypothetical protein